MARTAAADTPDLVMRVGLCCDADRNGEVQAVTLAPQPPIVPFVIGCTRRDQTQQPTVGHGQLTSQPKFHVLALACLGLHHAPPETVQVGTWRRDGGAVVWCHSGALAEWSTGGAV